MQENKDLIFAPDPIAQFHDWFALATTREVNDADAMSLATIGADGAPRVRVVLCKGADADGFRFFTNLASDKGRELSTIPDAAACFHWKSLRRQVRVVGAAVKLSAAEDDAYFSGRARESQIGAWASDQSRPLDSMATLAERAHEFETKFSGGPVPRPPHWGGFCLNPRTIEFWAERPHRLHERVVYSRDGEGWKQTRVYP